VDKFGFPKTKAKQVKRVCGFQTGDMVVLAGKKTGIYVGKVTIRASLSFNINTQNCTVQDISSRYCHLLQRADGYSYH
jgi:hypothetical protein